jgi:esterase/lipase
MTASIDSAAVDFGDTTIKTLSYSVNLVMVAESLTTTVMQQQQIVSAKFEETLRIAKEAEILMQTNNSVPESTKNTLKANIEKIQTAHTAFKKIYNLVQTSINNIHYSAKFAMVAKSIMDPILTASNAASVAKDSAQELATAVKNIESQAPLPNFDLINSMHAAGKKLYTQTNSRS